MAISYEKDEKNIVTLTIDMPGRSVNVINQEWAEAFEQVLAGLESEEPLAGVILTSAKKTFFVGGDIEMLFKLDDPNAAFELSEALKVGLRRLETLGVPVVAAVNGTALGGGLEIGLACHHRIAIDSNKIKMGFPEVTLGLLPGAGGVTRLTRMLGLQQAFPYLMEGKQVNPQKAKAAGIIDDLAADYGEMMQKAKAWILGNSQAVQPWDKRGYRMPGGNPHHPKIAQMLAIAPAMLRKKTFGNYPAPEAIMNAAVEGALVDFETASRIESRYFAGLASGQVAKNMISAFWFQLNEIKNGRSRPSHIPPQETKKVGVLGAGMMGRGIAYVTAVSGMDVVLKDVSLEKSEAGKTAVSHLLDQRVSRKRMTAAQKETVLTRIQPTDSAETLRGCDLIIEAVFEDRELKARVTQETEVHIEETAVFASNTSTLPITGLAERSVRPTNFIGLHFFSPVHKMKLVEIIRGEQTSAETLAKAFDYVLKINKTPIVVNDSRGFYTSRVFSTYTSEGLALLAEGQPPRAIESAGLQAGMPVGPLAISDEVSLSLMHHVREQTRKDLEANGVTLPQHPGTAVIELMVTELNRKGKAAGAGFYEYPKGETKYLWPQLEQLFPLKEQKLSQAEMIERMMFVQALETVRCYQEQVVESVADANIGSIFGWGFAPFKGGTLQYINDYGLSAFVERSHKLAQKYGERFAVPKLLIEMAAKGETF